MFPQVKTQHWCTAVRSNYGAPLFFYFCNGAIVVYTKAPILLETIYV